MVKINALLLKYFLKERFTNLPEIRKHSVVVEFSICIHIFFYSFCWGKVRTLQFLLDAWRGSHDKYGRDSNMCLVWNGEYVCILLSAEKNQSIIYCLSKERPYLEITLIQRKLVLWKCSHIEGNARIFKKTRKMQLICIKCMRFHGNACILLNFLENALKYLIINEKCHLASKIWWEQSEGYYLVWENR